MSSERRAYGLLRNIIERHGGSMVYRREGHPPHGAWITCLNGESTYPATGERSFPHLDCVYVAKTDDPQHWDDYRNELIPGAEEKLLDMHARRSTRA
jgi:hypothetical protein